MKKFFTLFAAVAISVTTFAQINDYPYSANWKYQDGVSLDENAGKPTADQSLYDLGGWSLAGVRPFYIAVSKSVPVGNTMEFVDGKQTPTQYTSYLISPAFNFSSNAEKVISLKCGKETVDNASSQLELIYSVDYDGDVATATWNSLEANLIPASQSGLGTSALATISVKTDLTAPSVYIAIRADKDPNAEAGSAQAKIRVTGFAITTQEKETVESIPYLSDWTYKAEFIDMADSTLVPSYDITNAGTYKENLDNLDFHGWVPVIETGDRNFYVSANKTSRKVAVNVVEWTDNKQSKTVVNTAWFISPKIDFSASGAKFVSFFCGREKVDQLSSNLELLYSTNYEGDYKTATWNSLQTNLIPAGQFGLNETTMAYIVQGLDLQSNAVTFAIKATKDENGSAGASQAKLRIRKFGVTMTDPTNVGNIGSTEAVKVFVAQGTKELTIINAQEVAKVEVFSIAGQSSMIQVQPSNTVSLSGLSNGVYLVRLTMNDGNTATGKIAIK